jgi:glycine amidinotransferase/scyllo-inosamine-4-phosphate amidinotransferase 1
MKLYSHNEWSPLKKVVVGNASFARIPQMDRSLRTVNYSNVIDDRELPTAGLYPIQVVEEANEDLEILCQELTKLGIEVTRPINRPTNYYNYCPRDLVTIVGSVAYVAPMSLQARKDEYKNLENLFDNIVIIPNDVSDNNYNTESIGNKDVLALHENYPKFDAANIIRANDDLLYLVSNSGNKKGAEYLQRVMHNSKVKVHTVEGIYSYMHIDSTIAFLREGLMLLNPSRIKDKSILPAPFNTWDAIYAPDPVDIGYVYANNASPWINVNLLSINEKLVVLEEHQEPTRKELEKYGIECLMLPMRHARTLGGCFHCVTLDLVRT